MATLTMTVAVAAAGASVALWAWWREHVRSAKQHGAREAHSQFLAAAETSLDAFGLFEAVRNNAGEIVDFRFLYVNANAERMVGRPRSDLLGQMLSSVTPIRSTGSMFAKFCTVVNTGEPLNEEFPVKYDSVKATWLRSQVVRLGDGLAVTFSDISEAKATEERYAHL
ncbi:MAG TPA: PAS domain-containing protein, partial [Edaphobacter sp.]|nr:PAS domain-containing protein [Edaphobacter sp.]